MASVQARAITSRKMLAVEGEDERRFFGKLFEQMELIGVQIEIVGGKDQFKNKLPALVKSSGFSQADGFSFVKHLAIVRDRDEDDAFDSIANIIKRVKLVPPCKHGEFSDADPRVGIFIMPGETIEGTMLEDLCLKTVERADAMTCVEQFTSCVAGLASRPKNPSKSRAQAFLAAQPDTVGSVGLGAQKGYWNLDSPVLEELKAFLGNLR